MIIVDDGIEVRTTFDSFDRVIRYVRTHDRTPTGTKRNIGAEYANGDIIANWDDDDFSHAHRLEDQVHRLLKTGKAVTGYCATVRFDEASRVLYTGSNCPPYFVSGTSQCYLKAWWDHTLFQMLAGGKIVYFPVRPGWQMNSLPQRRVK